MKNATVRALDYGEAMTEVQAEAEKQDARRREQRLHLTLHALLAAAFLLSAQIQQIGRTHGASRPAHSQHPHQAHHAKKGH